MAGKRPFSTPEHFWSRVDKDRPSGCWIWMGSRTGGYGTLSWQGRAMRAHRVALELAGVAVPDGWIPDHLCCVPSCVNPAHLEPVPFAENVRRGKAMKAWPIYCKEGHRIGPGNIYIAAGRRAGCRVCAVAKWRRAADAKVLREVLRAKQSQMDGLRTMAASHRTAGG